MESREDRNPNEDTQAAVLACLRAALLRALHREVRCPATASDLADETVARAWRRFFFDPLPGTPPIPWQLLWGWSVRVARNLWIDHRRHLRRANIDGDVAVEALAGMRLITVDELPSELTTLLVAVLAPCLRPAEMDTLHCLMAGVHDNAAIAALRGRQLRAVQESRRKIRAVGAQVWKECRTLHRRTSS